MVKYIFLLFVTLIMSGCSTPYISHSPLGGYGNKKFAGSLVKVDFIGDGFTSVAKAKKYVLRRAAEIGLQNHKPYFAAYKSTADAVLNRKITDPAVNTTVTSVTAFFYAEYHNKKEPGDLSVGKILKK